MVEVDGRGRGGPAPGMRGKPAPATGNPSSIERFEIPVLPFLGTRGKAGIGFLPDLLAVQGRHDGEQGDEARQEQEAQSGENRARASRVLPRTQQA